MDLQSIKNNWKKNIFFIVFLFTLVVGLCEAMFLEDIEYTSGNTNNEYSQKTGTVGMADPSAVYCSELGYQYQRKEGVCIFDDGVECDSWDFLKGKCGQNYSYCVKMGLGIKTVNDGKNPFSSEYAVCIDNDIGDNFKIHSSDFSMNKKEISVTTLFQLGKKASSKCLQSPEIFQSDKALKEENLQAPFVGPLPPAFDWRSNNNKNWLTPVKSQGRCGSCWAFSAIGAVESSYKINVDFTDLDLAEENLVSDCFDDGSCCGGWHYSALDFIRDTGITDEEHFSYVDGDCRCNGGSCSAETALYQNNTSEASNILDLLRNFRDEGLKPEYVESYYKYSPDIERILIRDPILVKDAGALIVKYAPAVKYIIGRESGEDLKISQDDIEQVISFTGRLKNKIKKEELVELINEFEEQFKLSAGKTFSQFFRNSIYFNNDHKSSSDLGEDGDENEEEGCQCNYSDVGAFSNICSNATCSDMLQNSELWKIRDSHKITSGSQEDIKRYLISHGPLTTAMRIDTGDDDGGEVFNEGIYECNNNLDVNHAVVIVGYNDEEEYWIIRNSWSSSWGDNGYFKVKYGECSIEDYAYYIEVDKPESKILSVPYYHQGDTDWCALTSMSMILKYYYNVDSNYSANIHSWDIANQLGFKRKIWFLGDLFLGEDEDEKVEKYFRDNDLLTNKMKDEDIKFDTIKKSIDDNNPIFLAIHKFLELNHAVVIVGYKIINGKEIVYINDPSGILSQKNIGQGRDSIVREVEWDDLSVYFGSDTYAILVGGSPNLTKGTLDIDMYRTNGFYFGDEGNRIYSWAYGDDTGMGWKTQSDRPQLLSKKDSFGYMQFITNHTSSEQSYKLKVSFSSGDNEYLADPIFINNVKEYDNKAIAFHPVPLESVLGDNYGEYEIALSLWGGDDFTEKYDKIVFPKLSYSCPWCSDNIIPVYLSGKEEQMIDIVFVPDESYRGHMDDFNSIVNELIHEQYFKMDEIIGSGAGTIPTNFKERFNFYVYTGGFSTNPEICGAVLPSNFNAPFADSIGTIVNQNGLIGCATSLGPPSRWIANKSGNVALHESMHSIFSLLDEYDIKYDSLCRDTHREELIDAPNLWSSLANCQNDVKSAGFSLGNCRQLVETGPSYCGLLTDWFRYDTDTPNPDLMTACSSGCNADYALYEADVRRINFVYNNWLTLSNKIKATKGISINLNINNDKITMIDSEVVYSYPNIGLQSEDFVVELFSSSNGTLLKYGISDPRINISIQGGGIEYPAFNDNINFNLVIPWEKGLKAVKIENRENEEMNIVMNVDEIIFDFCQENPTDPDCLKENYILETQIAITKMEYSEGNDILSVITADVGDGVAPLLLSELKESTVDLEDYTLNGKLELGQKKKLKMKFKFLETAGNEYQDKSINVKFKFLGTQEEY